MLASILGLATATPSHAYLQNEIVEKYIDMLTIDEEKSQLLRKMYNQSAIAKRHSVLGDFNKPRAEWDFWGKDYPQTEPSTVQRNEVYKREAPKLALEAAEKAIKAWGGDSQHLTHIISISCTGMVAPGIEFDIMLSLKLDPSIQRLGINFMGCFGAFKGLSVGQAFARENAKNRILIVCTELCTLHQQIALNSDTLVGNSIFADGAAAVILGMNPTQNEKPLWDILHLQSMGLENSLDKMSWELCDTGFSMRLSHKVPVLIGRNIGAFTKKLLPDHLAIADCDWPIHPGGKSILQAIEKALGLKKQQTQASWDVLANYGNMSSSTFLFVLDALSRQKEQKKHAVGMAFGPGLSFEGIVLKQSEGRG